MVLKIYRYSCHCEEPWAKSKGTKQSDHLVSSWA